MNFYCTYSGIKAYPGQLYEQESVGKWYFFNTPLECGYQCMHSRYELSRASTVHFPTQRERYEKGFVKSTFALVRFRFAASTLTIFIALSWTLNKPITLLYIIVIKSLQLPFHEMFALPFTYRICMKDVPVLFFSPVSVSLFHCVVFMNTSFSLDFFFFVFPVEILWFPA